MRGNPWLFVGAAVLLHAGFLETARRAPGTNWLVERAGGAEDALTIIETEDDDAGTTRVEARRTPEPVLAPTPEPQVEPAPSEPQPAAATQASTPAPIAALAPTEVAPEPMTEIDPEAFAGESSPFAEDAQPDEGTTPSEALAAAGATNAEGANDWSDPEPGGGSFGLGSLGLGSLGLGGVDLATALAVEGAAPTAAPTTIAESTVSAEKAANEAVKSTLIGQDKKVGIDLPATQVVVGAVATATRALPVAHNTRASFEVKLDGAGNVASVRVLKASGGDAATWQGAAKAAAASLSGRALGLGSAKGVGATVTVDVKVRHVFPSGSAKGADVKPVCANQIINDIAEAATSGKTKESADDTNVPMFTDENGRPCIPIGATVVSDETNIGATKQIQVQTASKVSVNGKTALPSDLQKVNTAPFWVKGQAGDAPRPVAPFRVRKWEKKREKKK